jgi:hypothetical protein
MPCNTENPNESTRVPREYLFDAPSYRRKPISASVFTIRKRLDFGTSRTGASSARDKSGFSGLKDSSTSKPLFNELAPVLELLLSISPRSCSIYGIACYIWHVDVYHAALISVNRIIFGAVTPQSFIKRMLQQTAIKPSREQPEARKAISQVGPERVLGAVTKRFRTTPEEILTNRYRGVARTWPWSFSTGMPVSTKERSGCFWASIAVP